MEFIDLKSQYRRLKTEIDAGIQRVLDHGQYIMGPEVQELEQALPKAADTVELRILQIALTMLEILGQSRIFFFEMLLELL